MGLNNEFKVKNDLNTLGRILSGGTDILSIFSPSNTFWTLSANNGTFALSGGDTLQVQGGNGVDVRVATSTDTVRISGIDATTSVKGVASFSSDNFAVTGGSVTVKSGGIDNDELAGSITDTKLLQLTATNKVANSATTATSANTANAIVARGASGEFSSGNITSSGTVQAVTVNATTGFRVNNGATSSNFLRGNGTDFVSSAIQVADVPTLNQNTTGSAATLTTTRTLWGQNFNGSQNVSGTLSAVGDIIGSSAITLSAGSGNNNINLTPSGSGLVTATGNLSASGTVTGNAVVASNITATNLLSAANTFTRQLSVGEIQVRTVGTSNVFIGDSTTGNNNATGNHNFVFGLSAGNVLTSGSSNVFIGRCAGRVNSSGESNNFLGCKAGLSNTTGDFNNFLGSFAGCTNIAGDCNNFVGPQTGYSNLSGCNNNFFGSNAGHKNTIGCNNNFFGSRAGFCNISGCDNNFIGQFAGFENTTGGCNNFSGYCAGHNNTSGSSNNFLGNRAGCCNTAGNNNNFFGYKAGSFNRTGSDNIFIGNNANTASAQVSALSGVIVLGTGAIATESHQIVLSTANVSFRNVGSTFEIGTPSLTDNLTVFGAVSSTGIVNTNTGFRISNAATSGNVLRGNGTNFVSSAIQVGDVPTLNQNTTGSAATLSSTRTLWGQGFNGSANVSGTLSAVGNIIGSGAVTLSATHNLDITLQTTGTGEVNIPKVDIDSGTIDGVSIGTNSAVTQLIVDDVEIDTATIGLKSGSSATALNINTRSATTPIVFNGNSAGTNAIISSGIGGDLILGTNLNNAANARLTLDDATNGNITFGLNGTGNVVIPRADINAGTIDGVTIGNTVAATSVSAALLDVDNIRVDGNTISSTNLSGNIVISPISNGHLVPGADNTVDLGSSSLEWKDLYIDGTANIDSLVADTADINGGTIDGTTIGLSVPASGVFTGITVSGNVSIDGNLFVSGTATQIDTANLIVQDPIIFLAEGNLADNVDIGFTAAYNHSQTPVRHTGFIRNNQGGEWTLFSNLSSEILSAVQIPLSDPSVVIDTLNANIKGTLTGNVSGTATQATKLVTSRTISTSGDVTYTSPSFDGTENVSAAATIANNAVTYAKFQQVAASSVVGNPTGSLANAQAIPASVTGFALLSATNAAAAATTIGLGTTNTATFGEVIVNNGTKSVASDVYNTTTATNVATLSTFANASYNSAKFTVQIKKTSTSARCALEIIATKNTSTWEGTVYGIVDPANIFVNVDITAGSTAELVFTLNGVASYDIVAYAQAISD